MNTPQNPGAPQGPQMLMQLFNAAHASAAVFSAIELDVFTQLAGGPQEVTYVADRIHCPARSTRILLNALAALGLLIKEGTAYRLAPTAEEHLVPGKPMYIGDFAGIPGSPMMWAGLARFSDAVRNNGTVLPEHAETPGNRFWETFARSSASMAGPASVAMEALLHDAIAARPKARVLDIAAGSGIYGYTVAQKNPNVALTTLDWPNVLVEAKQWAARVGVDASRVTYLPGNLFEVDYGGPYDVILLSHVYHHFDPPTCVALTRKVSQALAPGGRVAVQEFLSDDQNPAAAMFAATMLMWTRQGEAYSASDYRSWFVEGGLKAPAIHAIPGMPTSILVAEKA